MVSRLTRNILLVIVSWVLGSWIPALAQAQIQVNLVAPTDGVYTNTGDLVRPKTYAKALDNLHQNKPGIWTNSLTGYDSVTTGTGYYYGLENHTNSTGVEYVVRLVGSDAAAGTALNNWTAIGSSLSYTDDFPCMRSYSGSVFLLTNKNFEPKAWDGNTANTFAALAGWPITLATVNYSKPAFCETFLNRVAYAGFAAQPYTVVLSKAGTHNTFTVTAPIAATDAGAFTFPSALGPITGLRTIRIGNDTNDQILLVGCARGFAIIGGTDATNFYSREITRQYGLWNNRTWQQVGNTIYFAANDGIRSFSNLNTLATFVPTESYVVSDLWVLIANHWSVGGSTASGIVLDTDDTVFSMQNFSRQEIWFWIPEDSENYNPTPDAGYCNKVIVINYREQNADGSTKPVISTMSGATLDATCGVDFEVDNTHTPWVGYESKIYYFNGSTSYGSGVYIPWVYMSPLIETNSQNPQQSSTSRRFLIMTEGGSQNFTADVYALTTTQDGESVWKNVFSKRVSVTASTITNLGTWGADIGAGTTTVYPHIIELDPPGNARYWVIRLYAAQTGDVINLVGIAQQQIVGGLKQ